MKRQRGKLYLWWALQVSYEQTKETSQIVMHLASFFIEHWYSRDRVFAEKLMIMIILPTTAIRKSNSSNDTTAEERRRECRIIGEEKK